MIVNLIDYLYLIESLRNSNNYFLNIINYFDIFDKDFDYFDKEIN